MSASQQEKIVIELLDTSSDDDDVQVRTSPEAVVAPAVAVAAQVTGDPTEATAAFQTPTPAAPLSTASALLDDDSPTPTRKNIQRFRPDFSSSPAMNTRKRKSCASAPQSEQPTTTAPTAPAKPVRANQAKRTRRSTPAPPPPQPASSALQSPQPSPPSLAKPGIDTPCEAPSTGRQAAPVVPAVPSEPMPAVPPRTSTPSATLAEVEHQEEAKPRTASLSQQIPDTPTPKPNEDDDLTLPDMNIPTFPAYPNRYNRYAMYHTFSYVPSPITSVRAPDPPKQVTANWKERIFGTDQDNEKDELLDDVLNETRSRPKQRSLSKPVPTSNILEDRESSPVDIFSLFSQPSATPVTVPAFKKGVSPDISVSTVASHNPRIPVIVPSSPCLSAPSSSPMSSPTPSSPPIVPISSAFPMPKKELESLTLSLVLHSRETNSQVLDGIELHPDDSFEIGVEKCCVAHHLNLHSNWVLAYQNTKVSKHCTPRMMGFSIYVTLDLFQSEKDFEHSQETIALPAKLETADEDEVIRLVLKDPSKNELKLKLNPQKALLEALTAFQKKFDISKTIQVRGPEGDLLEPTFSCAALGLEDEDLLHIQIT